MSDGAILCPEQFAKWEDEYEEWGKCKEQESEALADAVAATAAAAATCVGAAATVVTVIGAFAGGGACGLALWNEYDKWDDWGDKQDDCNKQAKKSNTEGDKYKKCVADHKKD